MKNARHVEILRLISEQAVETQEELAALLNSSGFQVTQATVSRDIRQLCLQKVQGADGSWHYTAQAAGNPELLHRHQRVLRDSFVSMDVSSNILVIHTVSGMAMAGAAALDLVDWPEIRGSIAGDDTIMAVIRSSEDAPAVMEKIGRIVE